MSKYQNIEFHAAQFKALSNPNRLTLFKRLMSCCAPGTVCSTTDEAVRYCVGELGKGLGIAPSTVSHHLKELSQAGLIQTKRQGKTIHCWIEPSVLNELGQFFAYRESE